MNYKRFEDLPVWQKSRLFVNKIYAVIYNNKKLQKDYALNDQLKRATYSVMLNIAEGFERKTNREFANFINIAKGSAGEVRCILYILLDNNYIVDSEQRALLLEIENISMDLSNFYKYLVKSHIVRKK
ncbi:four helix bundle protein [Patescibacteria group bacterium]|nr:four helix bundle protein [Patescibacteria group bacterium]